MDQTYKVGHTFYPKQVINTKNNRINNSSSSFNNIFNEKLQLSDLREVKFSSHAKQRLDSRGIKLDSTQLSQLNQAVQKAAQKGAKDSLILMQNLAFVVSITNRVVITTVDQNSMKDHVFTNIDSAIIV
ncbi:hypothetical protein BHF71_00415 [Vulcanibacillus modesticaldus]|uniref:Flagellar protein n=1 Tax=Vulcanibacillus modesticaldus TaxID=337097 RepID=A0A1D2YXQ1_9BACI|nr:TIGR02530 family flagellar biosynthesis protein [Vulcanibacillus modesticaldus]OEG00407.1 hypothetical protein BHF71_00415 [Vulcanibacillus modesticaldus]